jgi:hypothetical protein
MYIESNMIWYYCLISWQIVLIKILLGCKISFEHFFCVQHKTYFATKICIIN